MPSNLKKFCYTTLFLLLGGALILSSAANAQNITLKQNNGALVVHGKLIKFDGAFYVVDSEEFGSITIDARKFSCTAGQCPQSGAAINAGRNLGRPVSNNFAIHGSNTIGAKLMPTLIESYAKKISASTKKILGSVPEEMKLILTSANGDKLSSIDLHSYGSGTSAKGLAARKAQIGMSSRPIKAKEVNLLLQNGISGIKNTGNENILAMDGLLVIVAPNNSISALTIQQISQIFSGQISDWSQLGRSKPGPINIYARDAQSGTFDTFKSLVLKANNVKLSPNAKRFQSNTELSDNVASDPNGIGFTGFAYKRNAKALSIASSCGITKQPNLFNVKSEEYPLARRLYLYTSPQVLSSPFAKKLLNYAMSDEAQAIIPKIGFINQSIHLLPFNNQGNRVAAALNVTAEDFNIELVRQFMKEFAGATRLSVTFRFKTGSTRLTNKSESDVKRFSNYLMKNKAKGKEIFLVGFSDSTGAFEKNRELAFKRALAIKFAILSASSGQIPMDNLKIKSYGELFPVSCNTTPAGQKRNRRVEVWVR